ITPDGNFLYVADSQGGPTQGWVRKINLNTWEVSGIAYNQLVNQGGVEDIAIRSDGKALVTTWGIFRPENVFELDLATNSFTPMFTTGIGMGGMMSRSVDRNRIFLEVNGGLNI